MDQSQGARNGVEAREWRSARGPFQALSRRVAPTPTRRNVPPTQWLQTQTASPTLHARTRWARWTGHWQLGPGACKGRRVLVRFPPFCAWANRGNQRPSARVLASFWQPFALQRSAATAECLAATPGCPRTLPLDIRLHTRRGIGQTRERSLQPLHTACWT